MGIHFFPQLLLLGGRWLRTEEVQSYSECVKHLPANNAYILPKSYLFVKNILHCVVAKLSPTPVPTETGWLGFRVRCHPVLSGALMCQLLPQHSFYFQSPGWFYTLFLCKGIRISGSFVSEGRGWAASPLSSLHRGILASKARSFDLLLTRWLFQKRKDPLHQAALLEARMAMDWGDRHFQNAARSHQARVTLALHTNETFPAQ